MTAIGPAAQQGIISTQVERVVNDRPTASEAPRSVVEVAPSPSVETGRGAELDTSA